MRPRTRKWLYVLLAAATLFGATAMVPPINAQRKEAHLVLPPAPDDAAMSMLYTPLLAIGRAPLVDVLWMRATKLKEEGRIFDALQLAALICDLQPKFPDVWAFQAWNMSYNISVTCKSPEERWRWVRNGYELIRDQGIPLNPNNTQLYRELSWILFHKVGDTMDDWHWYYKNEFAKIAENILGKPPADYVRPGRVRGDFYRNYDYPPLALMPERIDQLYGEGIVPALERQYRLTTLRASEVISLIDAKADAEAVDAFVKSIGRPGVNAVEVKTLLDLLRVEFHPVTEMVKRLRIQAASESAGGGIGGLIRNDPAAGEFARKMSEYGFEIDQPGVFNGLMNSLRTGKVVMPHTPERQQDIKAREFLAVLRDDTYKEARDKLSAAWREQVALDLTEVQAAWRKDVDELRRFAGELGKFGFDANDGQAYLGIDKAVRDEKLEIAGVAAHEQEAERRKFLAVWDAEDNAYPRYVFDRFWRSVKLRNEFKLDPMRLVRMHNNFGVIFDYRFPESHSLYWATLGTEVGTDKREPVDIHRLNTDRIEFYCLQKMYYRGRIAMSPEADMGEPPLLSSDLRVVPALVKAFYEGSKEYLKSEHGRDEHGISENFRTGFVGFMRDATLTYHEYGYDEESKKLFDILRNEFPDPMYTTYEGFLMQEVVEDRKLGDYRVTLRRIKGLLRQAIQSYAYDEDEQALQFVERAKEIYEFYHANVVSKRLEIKFTFDELRKEAMDEFAFVWNRRETYERVCAKMGVEPIPERERRPDASAADAAL